MNILEPWCELETRVEVNAGAFLDGETVEHSEGAETFCIIRTDAAAEEERGLAGVIGEHGPVELRTIAANRGAFCVEEKVIDDAFIRLDSF